MFGADDFHVAMTLDHVAEAYAAQARYADAEEMYGRVLAILAPRLGPDDPLAQHVLTARRRSRCSLLKIPGPPRRVLQAPANPAPKVPARYVVDQDRRIRAADFHPDYTMRPAPEDTVAAVRPLQAAGSKGTS